MVIGIPNWIVVVLDPRTVCQVDIDLGGNRMDLARRTTTTIDRGDRDPTRYRQVRIMAFHLTVDEATGDPGRTVVFDRPTRKKVLRKSGPRGPDRDGIFHLTGVPLHIAGRRLIAGDQEVRGARHQSNTVSNSRDRNLRKTTSRSQVIIGARGPLVKAKRTTITATTRESEAAHPTIYETPEKTFQNMTTG